MSNLVTENTKGITKVLINDRYMIIRVLKSLMGCRIYKGIDINNHTYVNIYVKSVNSFLKHSILVRQIALSLEVNNNLEKNYVPKLYGVGIKPLPNIYMR